MSPRTTVLVELSKVILLTLIPTTFLPTYSLRPRTNLSWLLTKHHFGQKTFFYIFFLHNNSDWSLFLNIHTLETTQGQGQGHQSQKTDRLTNLPKKWCKNEKMLSYPQNWSYLHKNLTVYSGSHMEINMFRFSKNFDFWGRFKFSWTILIPKNIF